VERKRFEPFLSSWLICSSWICLSSLVCYNAGMSELAQSALQLALDSTPNTEWHAKHALPQNPTLDERVNWHMDHARRCPCLSNDEDILPELQKRYGGKHQDFWIEHHINDHRMLGLWAAECAERLLPYFEEKYGADPRPRDAIQTLREWVNTGKFSMSVIRAAALAAHELQIMQHMLLGRLWESPMFQPMLLVLFCTRSAWLLVSIQPM
jgi:hypothetical protein